MNLANHTYGDTIIVKGNDEQARSCVCVSDALKQRGAWYVLLRAHDAIWRDRSWNFSVRFEASRKLWDLCNEVPHSKGKR